MDEAQLESRLPGENQEPQICSWHHPYGRKWRSKEPLDESEKVGLKLNIQKTKIMASSPITSWQINSAAMNIGLHVSFWIRGFFFSS